MKASGLPREHQLLCDHFVYIPSTYSQGHSATQCCHRLQSCHHFATWANYAEAPRDPAGTLERSCDIASTEARSDDSKCRLEQPACLAVARGSAKAAPYTGEGQEGRPCRPPDLFEGEYAAVEGSVEGADEEPEGTEKMIENVWPQAAQ